MDWSLNQCLRIWWKARSSCSITHVTSLKRKGKQSVRCLYFFLQEFVGHHEIHPPPGAAVDRILHHGHLGSRMMSSMMQINKEVFSLLICALGKIRLPYWLAISCYFRAYCTQWWINNDFHLFENRLQCSKECQEGELLQESAKARKLVCYHLRKCVFRCIRQTLALMASAGAARCFELQMVCEKK